MIRNANAIIDSNFQSSVCIINFKFRLLYVLLRLEMLHRFIIVHYIKSNKLMNFKDFINLFTIKTQLFQIKINL